jgi:site-specific DNA-cytosine methylase
MFLLENVAHLLEHDRGRTFAIVLQELTAAGCVLPWTSTPSETKLAYKTIVPSDVYQYFVLYS